MRYLLHTLRAGEIGDGEQALPGQDTLHAWHLQDGAVLRTPAGCLHAILVLRHRVDIQCCDGRWSLAARRWLLLGREVAPVLRGSAGAQALVISLDARSLPRFDPEGQWLAPLRGGLGLAAWRTLMALSGPFGPREREGDLDDASVAQLLSSLLARTELEGGLCGRTPGRTEQRRRQLLARMLRARLFIEGHTDRVVRITELARLCNFSPWHFTKSFHQIFGETPQACGVRVRLDQARRLATESRLAISEIAARCGFDNASSFARAFQKRFGECASAMRSRRPWPGAMPRRSRSVFG